MVYAHALESRERAFGVNRSAALVILIIAGLASCVSPMQVAAQSRAPLVDSQSSTASSSPAVSATIPDDYLIGEDDVLNVYVVDVPEFSRQYRVSSGGTVSVP